MREGNHSLKIEYFAKNISRLFFIFLTLHFIFNFLFLPGLQYVYVVEVLLAGVMVFMLPWNKLLLVVFALLFVEGQGRILWSYQPWSRLIFDSLLLIIFVRFVITQRKVVSLKRIPNYILILIILHFLWYGFELFNFNNVGVIGVLAAAKIYIVPLLIFFMLLANPLTEEELRELQKLIIVLLIVESMLAIVQMSMRETALLALHPYYATPLRGEQFSGIFFRPFATSFNPGSYSVFYFLVVGIMFLFPLPWKFRVLQVITVVLSLIALFLSQVRSALLKYILELGLLFLSFWSIGKQKIRTAFIGVIGGVSVVLLLWKIGGHFNFYTPELINSFERALSLTNIQQISKSRINFSTFWQVSAKHLSEHPLGLGPGRTGAANTFNMDKILQDPEFGKSASWANDNLWISLFIDLGFGAWFYILLVWIIPLKIIAYRFLHQARLSVVQKRILLISGISMVIILLGNWGAIGLPYNPESFMFWFWASLGFNQLLAIKDSKDAIIK